jgi:predicted transcriptional regulator
MYFIIPADRSISQPEALVYSYLVQRSQYDASPDTHKIADTLHLHRSTTTAALDALVSRQLVKGNGSGWQAQPDTQHLFRRRKSQKSQWQGQFHYLKVAIPQNVRLLPWCENLLYWAIISSKKMNSSGIGKRKAMVFTGTERHVWSKRLSGWFGCSARHVRRLTARLMEKGLLDEALKPVVGKHDHLWEPAQKEPEIRISQNADWTWDTVDKALSKLEDEVGQFPDKVWEKSYTLAHEGGYTAQQIYNVWQLLYRSVKRDDKFEQRIDAFLRCFLKIFYAVEDYTVRKRADGGFHGANSAGLLLKVLPAHMQHLNMESLPVAWEPVLTRKAG